jgi:hypothetical protein
VAVDLLLLEAPTRFDTRELLVFVATDAGSEKGWRSSNTSDAGLGICLVTEVELNIERRTPNIEF